MACSSLMYTVSDTTTGSAIARTVTAPCISTHAHNVELWVSANYTPGLGVQNTHTNMHTLPGSTESTTACRWIP